MRLDLTLISERVTGIEPALSAWELPMIGAIPCAVEVAAAHGGLHCPLLPWLNGTVMARLFGHAVTHLIRRFPNSC